MTKELEIFKAINTLAEFLKQEPSNICARLALFDKEDWGKITKTYNSCVEFYKLPLEERYKSMGYEVKKTKEGFEVSTVL